MGLTAQRRQEIIRLALDAADGKVFTSAMVSKDAPPSMLLKVFLPLADLSAEGRRQLRETKPYLLYEYYSKALCPSGGPYPAFETVKMLNEVEYTVFTQAYEEYSAAVKEVRGNK